MRRGYWLTAKRACRAQSATQLFEGPYWTEMVEHFSDDGSDITPPKHQPLTGLLKDVGRDYVKLNDTVYLHHRAELLPPATFETPRRAPRQPEPQALVPWSPANYAANFMGW